MSRAAALRRVEIHLGTRCNSRCVFCMSSVNRDAKEPWVGFDGVKKELRHFREKGNNAAGFLGGEPTIYPHILESIAYAKTLGFERISICSNGIRLADPEFCRELVSAGLSRVTLSVHSHRAEIEDGLITRVPGSLARKISAIRHLKALQAEGLLPGGIALNPVLCRPTLSGMEEYLVYFSGLGVDDIRFNFIWPQGGATHDRGWVPSVREAAPAIIRAMLINERRLRLRLTFAGLPLCALSRERLSDALSAHLSRRYLDEAGFDPDNDVSLATSWGTPGDRFVWQKVKRDVFKVKAPSCARCRKNARCEGVWATYRDLHGIEELVPLC